MFRPFLFALCLLAGPAPAFAESGTVQSVETRVIAAEPFVERLVLRGRTEAVRRVDLRAEVSGLVASAPIRKGAVVAAGDTLCRLDPGERPAALAEARAELAKAEADAAAADSLAERGFAAETEALRRRADLEAARARALRAEIGLGRLEIAAPFDGVLESDTAETGALLQPGSVCATVIALDPIELVGFAPERDVESITVGAEARATLVTGREVEGRVRFVSRSADEETRTFRIEVEAENADLSIPDGMTAEIFIPLPARPAHFVPQSALTLDDGGRLGLRLVIDGRTAFHPVSLLSDEPGGVWVSGLPERAEVIVVGQEFVADGQPVEASAAPPGAF